MKYKHIELIENGKGLTLLCNTEVKPKNNDDIAKWKEANKAILVHSSQIMQFIDLAQYNYIGNLGHLHSNWYEDIKTGIEIDKFMVEFIGENIKYGFIKEPEIKAHSIMLMDTSKPGKTFELTAEQMEKFEVWQKSKYDKHNMKTYTFCFTPTGIGMNETIKCSDGTQLDLTNYETW